MTTDERLERLQAELSDLRLLIEERVVPPMQPIERPDDLIGAEEAARLLNISVRTLRERKAGTKAIPRQQSHPILFLRRDVQSFVRQRAKRQRAAAQRSPFSLLKKRKPRSKAAA